MNKAVKELVELCKYAAKHPYFVQGGGGNCSVKLDGTIAIKASGYFLDDVTDNDGFVLVNLIDKSAVYNSQLKPSLEIEIHYLLGNYVIHTHPIVVGALVCAKHGRGNFKQIFADAYFFWIDYTSPGKELANKVRTSLKTINDLNKPIVLFLENHGIFVSNSSKESCINLHENIIKRLELFFGKVDFHFEEGEISGYLTPDHVVYSKIDMNNISEKQRTAKNELDLFSKAVVSLIKRKKWDVKYLTNNEVAFIANMEEERYRQKILDKGER